MKNSSTIWMPTFVAFQTLQQRYKSLDFYPDEKIRRQTVSEVLLRRLQSGELPARAATLTEEWDNAFDLNSKNAQLRDFENMIPVLPSFWRGFQASKPEDRKWDWIAGDFEFKIIAMDGKRGWGNNGTGAVTGLQVDAARLPQFAWQSLESEENTRADQLKSQRSGGRPPAIWWPDFAEELAVYIHENGIPDGHGNEGQSTLINAVFGRMVEQGKIEPSRVTVQRVVNAVLQRIRSAGNDAFQVSSSIRPKLAD